MKIKNLKINGFGKLQKKEIEFRDRINIVYGENEAGKSTLLKFITGMFYGASKNKNGENIPDIEKYKPWNCEDFSGKIKYVLDNNETFEVYREFKKKNPKIFNSNLEDISKEFNIDKTKGNLFFYDQTGIDEDIFTSSAITKQGKVRLDEKNQNNIIQRISNILGTGEDSTSYEKVLAKLKKKLNDEIGTNNTKEKPINIVEKRIEQIESEEIELRKYQDYQFEIADKINNNKMQIIEAKEKLETLKMANIKLDKIKADESKIDVVKKLVEQSKEDIKNFEQTSKIELPKTKKINKILLGLLIICSALCALLIKNNIIRFIPTLITIVLAIFVGYFNSKNRKEIKEKKNKYQAKLKILKNNKEIQEGELLNLESKYKQALNDICNQYNIKDVQNIIEQINELQTYINELTLNLHTMQIDNEHIQPKLEKYINLEEELESKQEEKRELEDKREKIKKAMEYLEIAYYKMKQEITPKFTDKLSKTISKISDKKYQNVRINTKGEIIVEDKNGEYINAENLSIGTIDQLYLSLRLASIEEITKEKMPIILDEAFAYYDNDRLTNILKYLSEEYKDNQMIIFTCTKREKEILDKINVAYEYIQL